MKPPEATQADQRVKAGDTPPAVSVCPLETLTKRADFVRASRARRQSQPGLLLQARERGEDEVDGDLIRIGYTCSKKVGNAVARNRAKRRLREVARTILPYEGKSGWDYVLVGRPSVTAARPFDDLKNDLSVALRKIHAPKARR